MSGHRIGKDGRPSLDHHPVVGHLLWAFNTLNRTPPIPHATREDVLELRRRQIELTRRVRAVEDRLNVLQLGRPEP